VLIFTGLMNMEADYTFLSRITFFAV